MIHKYFETIKKHRHAYAQSPKQPHHTASYIVGLGAWQHPESSSRPERNRCYSAQSPHTYTVTTCNQQHHALTQPFTQPPCWNPKIKKNAHIHIFTKIAKLLNQQLHPCTNEYILSHINMCNKQRRDVLRKRFFKVNAISIKMVGACACAFI